jgi:CRP-like cAMP-binding protein
MHEITAGDLLRRLQSLSSLDDAEADVVSGLLRPGIPHPAGAVLLQQGEAVRGPHILTSGWAWRTRTLPSGRQQVFAIVLPGDFMGLCWRPNPRALSSTVAITSVQTCDIATLQPVMAQKGEVHRGLWEALTLASRHDEMRLLDQVVRLGQQSAIERVASLMLELHSRLSIVGMTDDYGFQMPLTQEHLAVTLGMSLVHVNRTVQLLRKEGLAEIGNGRATLLEPDRLRSLSSFEATARAYAEAV